MTIEEAIKVKRFENEHEKAIINILFTASWIDSKNIQRLKTFGISPQQYNVLRILRGSKHTTLKLTEIAERMIDRNSNATRLVEKLRQKNFLERESCPNDRRQVAIKITEKGLRILEEIDKTRIDFISSFTKLTHEELITLNELLNKVRS
jgi:DNA-binding MarR family transcriptional regulator